MKLTVTVQDLFGVWDTIEDKIQERLPLRQLHWKSQHRPLRSIPSLDVELRAYEVDRDDKALQHEGSLDKPVLNLFIVKCEDVDIYHNHVRQLIRDWYNAVITKPNQQWLILHVAVTEPAFSSTGPPRNNGSKFFNLKVSVFDKIRSDFNGSSKRDQCAQLRLGDGRTEMEVALDDLFVKMKALIIISLSGKIETIEEEIRKTKANQQTPGWNFCTFFVLKEDLALTFQSMSLYEDGLVQYDELEAFFIRALTDQHLDHFEPSVSLDEEDLISSILDISRRPYRDLILQNKITLFDFRIYLFARQVLLLVNMRKFSEILTRGLAFIHSLTKLLEDLASENELFVPLWTFNAIDCIVSLIPAEHYDLQTAAGRGDIRKLQRQVLKEIERSLADTPDNHEATIKGFKNSRLRGIFATQNSLSTHFQNLNESILVDYKFAGKTESVALIGLDMAEMSYAAQDYSSAARRYESAIDFGSHQPWDALTETYLGKYVDCLVKLDQLSKCVMTCLEVLSDAKLPTSARDLVEMVNKLSREVSEGLDAKLGDYGSVAISRFIEHTQGKPEIVLCLDFESYLPSALNATCMLVTLVGEAKQEWVFALYNFSLPAGKSRLSLHSNDYFPGDYSVNRVRLDCGRVQLKQDFESVRGPLLKVHSSQYPIKLELCRQKTIHLDQPRQMALGIYLESLTLSQCLVKIESLETGLNLNLKAVSVYKNGNEKITFEVKDGSLVFDTLSANSAYILSVPYLSDTPVVEISSLVTISYSWSGLQYSFVSRMASDFHLPLAVNVQDFFRLDRLYSKFQISCIKDAPLRLLHSTLTSSLSFSVEPQGKEVPGAILLGGHPCSKVFAVRPTPDELQTPMRLQLRYRRIYDEILLVLRRELAKIFTDSDLSPITEGILSYAFERASTGYDVQTSALLGCVVQSQYDEAYWRTILNAVRPADREVASAAIHKISSFEDFSLSGEVDSESDQFVEIPVDIPPQVIVHQAAIRLASGLLEVGKPISAVLTIVTSTIWCRQQVPAGLRFAFEVEVDENSWILVGKSHGSFATTDSIESQLKLIPVRAGSLLVPSVDVQASDPTFVSETHLLSSNSEALVRTSDSERSIHF